MKKIILLIALAFISVINANAADIIVYPLPAVFNTYKGIGSDEFQKFFNENRKDFINKYLIVFDKFFPHAQSEISDKVKYKTFAVYVNIPRVSLYKVQKTEKLLDIYMPLTMSLNFVNMATGETIYSYPVTNYYKYETTVQNNIEIKKQRIKEAYERNYEQTLNEVISHASVKFKPLNITTKIIDVYKNVYILDKGKNIGIVKGDLLTDENLNQLSVIYSDLNYSVAEKILGKPKINDNFTKFSNNSITQLKKTKILFINDIGNEMAYDVFATAIGEDASFSLITTNKTFYDMQEALVSLNSNFKTENLYNRSLPDYFIKLYFTKPAYGQYKSNKDYLNIDKYSMTACGVVFDRTGRIVFSKCVNDEIVNKVISGIRFKDDANLEIITKNIFNKLAESMIKNIQFKNVNFKITKVNNDYITLKDTNGFLKVGNILTVFKKVKNGKIRKNILVPTFDYKVVSTQNGIVDCRMSKPYLDDINYPSKKDIIQITTVAKSAAKANILTYVSDEIELEGNEVSIHNFDNIALAALAANLKMPVAVPESQFQNQINELRSQGFKDVIKIDDNNSNNTIKVVYKIVLQKETVKNTIVEKEFDITVGIIQKKDNKIIKQEGISQKVTIVLPNENNTNLQEQELLKDICPLIENIAKDF